ncbi:MAG TPA: hypothetical protein VN695_19935, partial [Streptosporangiaceae bacterium]|nr:hypothetical protein [Streptosporangiaceae bacterium]
SIALPGRADQMNSRIHRTPDRDARSISCTADSWSLDIVGGYGQDGFDGYRQAPRACQPAA